MGNKYSEGQAVRVRYRGQWLRGKVVRTEADYVCVDVELVGEVTTHVSCVRD